MVQSLQIWTAELYICARSKQQLIVYGSQPNEEAGKRYILLFPGTISWPRN